MTDGITYFKRRKNNKNVSFEKVYDVDGAGAIKVT